MKKVFTQKLSFAILSFLLFSFQLSAGDLTNLITNPSFELSKGEAGSERNPGDPLPQAATTERMVPYGWHDSSAEYPISGQSYGVNQNAQKGKNGLYVCWVASIPCTEFYELYQEIPGLPAGKYVVSCNMVAFHKNGKLTNQRLFANKVVQYPGSASDYVSNLTAGETNTFAGWELPGSDTDPDAILKPMSVVVEIAEGEVLRFGIKTSNLKSDGTRYTGNDNTGWFKVDNFRLSTYSETPDPNDYTSKIKNPSFELGFVGGVETRWTAHNATVERVPSTSNDNWAPYGWQAQFTGFVGNSYGVNQDANNMDGGFCMWVQSTPMPNFTLYQDITDLPAGKYEVSCSMWVQDNNLVTTQRLFANNNVQYFGTQWDYYGNLTEGENATYADWKTSTNSTTQGRMLQKMAVQVDIAAGEHLKLGVKTNNILGGGAPAASNSTAGLFKIDNFRLKLIQSSGLDKVNKNTLFSIKNQNDGILLNMENTTAAYVKVFSLSGQNLYSMPVSNTETKINLAKGLYIVQVVADGKQEVEKVLVK